MFFVAPFVFCVLQFDASIIIKCSKFTALLLLFVMVLNIPAEAYTFSQLRKETPQDFNDFLASCTPIERIQMLQALKDLPKLKDEYFGNLAGLPPLDRFTTDKSKATLDMPLKPSTFNEVLPDTVMDAVRREIITDDQISPSQVRKALVWRAYNKATYYFRGDKEVDYHEIVQWVANKAGVEKELINRLPTFALEGKIEEKYFEALWDKLNQEQRMAVLSNIEKESGINFDKGTIAAMGGAAAIGALQSAILYIGLPAILASLYSALATILFGGTIAAWIGTVFGYASGWLGSPLAWMLTGPLGFTITAGVAGLGVFLMGSAEKETVSVFVMTVNLIKANKYAK